MPFGVYVHIPFCAHRCDYCDFATWTDRDHLIDAYVDACITDIRRRSAPLATSVFFGGGTPSLLPGNQLARILAAIDLAPGAEVTVECNPDSVDAAKFAAYRDGGVNRLSFGVQSMASHVLAALNRTHDPANVERAVALARAAGFTRINLDLIYGTPGETLADWERTVAGALALGAEHISAYALTVEPATPLGKRVAAGAAAPDDDFQADAYAVADDAFAAAGMEWYEISNWARPGEECRHNLLYWTEGEYLGIGCAAHGHTGRRRWWNVRTPERYIAAIANSAGAGEPNAEAGAEELDDTTRNEEAFSLGLRTRAGSPFAPAAASLVAELVAADLVTVHDDGGGVERIVLTRRGRLLASDVTAGLLLGGAASTWHSVPLSANVAPDPSR